MFTIEQYNSIFSIGMYLLMVLPAVVSAFFGKKFKILNLAISAVMIVMLLGFRSLQMWEFIIFLMAETALIYFYYFFRKRCGSELVYFIVFILSIVPLAAIKLYGRTDMAAYIGFTGVSYISFKIWEIIIEIHDGRIEELDFLDLIGFLAFAPSFSSGPIGRYPHYLEESKREVPRGIYIDEYLVPGMKKIVLGMLYKFSLAFLINEYVMSRYEYLSLKGAIAYMYSYTLYLFFDFAGYSLMAIGTGYLLGIRMPENFNKPFLAKNLKEFWDRWHISLSSWFNDFLFSRFVLDNMRNGLFKNPSVAARCAYFCTMMVMGFWHGLYGHYILYGFYHGILLVATDIWIKSKTYRKVKKKKYYSVVSRFACFHVIAFGMLIFSGFVIPE